MPAKPATTFSWATGGGALKTDPGAAQKAAGWAVGQRPPAQWWNWIWNLIGDWILYLDDFENNAHTWTAKQTFSRAGLTDNVAALAIDDAPVGNWGLVDQVTLDGTVFYRRYQQAGSVWFVETYNAQFTLGGPPDWAADDAGSDAIRIIHTASGINLEFKTAAATWAEGDWTAAGAFTSAGITADAAGADIESTGGDIKGLGVASTSNDVASARDVTAARAVVSSGYLGSSVPTVAVNAAVAGVGATAAIMSGNDVAGIVRVTTGVGPIVGVYATITMTGTHSTTPSVVLLFPWEQNALGQLQAVGGLVNGVPTSATTWDILIPTVALAGATIHQWIYIVIG